jgi:Fur family ferric uptake transcriptional regulator
VSLPAVAVSQTPEDKFREYLASRPKPQRFTDQQRELLEHVFARHSHFDAEQLIDNLKAAGKRVSRATVYRTLSKLVDAGLPPSHRAGRRPHQCTTTTTGTRRTTTSCASNAIR